MNKEFTNKNVKVAEAQASFRFRNAQNFISFAIGI